MSIVVKDEVTKILNAGIIYAISDSQWVSPVHYVPKKGGITVTTNKAGEHIAERVVSGSRMCINYRKLNKATQKTTSLFHSLIKCLSDWISIPTTVIWTVTQDFFKLLSTLMTKKRQHLRVLMVR